MDFDLLKYLFKFNSGDLSLLLDRKCKFAHLFTKLIARFLLFYILIWWRLAILFAFFIFNLAERFLNLLICVSHLLLIDLKHNL